MGRGPGGGWAMQTLPGQSSLKQKDRQAQRPWGGRGSVVSRNKQLIQMSTWWRKEPWGPL